MTENDHRLLTALLQLLPVSDKPEMHLHNVTMGKLMMVELLLEDEDTRKLIESTRSTLQSLMNPHEVLNYWAFLKGFRLMLAKWLRDGRIHYENGEGG